LYTFEESIIICVPTRGLFVRMMFQNLPPIYNRIEINKLSL
jgi:hypothetical protein